MNQWGKSIAATLLTGMLAAAAFAATVVSGLPSGEHMTAFNVHDVCGPAKGQTLCYV